MSSDGGYRGPAVPLPDVSHEPGCLRVGTQWYDRGKRANGESVWELWCIDCRARLILVDGQPEPPGSDPDAEATANAAKVEAPALDKPTPTSADAIAAYAEHRSDRKAAAALRISRTHLRRLRGVQD